MLNIESLQGIEQVLWGVVDSREVRLFCLKNSQGTRVYVSNFGATAQSLICADRYNNFADILLGYESLEDYQQDDFYMGAVIGRYANRIAGGQVFIEGERYELATRDGGYHLHGGVRGFNKQLFDYHIPPNSNGNTITFTYTSDHLEEGFPGKLDLKITYTLKDDNSWIVDYEARSDRATLVNLTQHAYFNLSGTHGSNIENHVLRINGRFYLPVNRMQIPTGELADVHNTPFDFTRERRIGEAIQEQNDQLSLGNGFDHSWALEQQHTPFLKHAAMVKDPVSGRKLDVYTTEPAVHFYSGNFLGAITGKGGVQYKERSGLCLETQHFPDAPNHAHFPSTLLRAGELFTSQTIFRLSVS